MSNFFTTETAVSNESLNPLASDSGIEGITYEDNGSILNGTQGGLNSLGKLSGIANALLDFLGTPSTRRSAPAWYGTPDALSGTWTWTTGSKILNGTGGSLSTELNANEWIWFPGAGLARKVQSIGSDNQMTLYLAFPSSASGVAISRLTTLSERLDGMPSTMAGIIIGGGLTKNGNNPPTVKSGVYSVSGKTVKLSASVTSSFALNSLGDTAIANHYWYYMLLNSAGVVKTHIAYGSQVGALSNVAIQSITSSGGGVFKIKVLNAVDLSSMSVGNVAVSLATASAANRGVFAVTAFSNTNDSGGSGFKYIDVKNSSGVAQASVIGNISVYHRIGTNDTDTSTIVYSPQPAFDEDLQGYYSPYDSTYRVLGYYYSDGSGVVQNIVSFRSGSDKSDSWLWVTGSNNFGSSGTLIPRYLTVLRQHGSDLTYTDDASNGMSITVNHEGFITISAFTGSVVASESMAITLNESGTLSTAITSLADDKVLQLGGGVSSPSVGGRFRVKDGDVIRVHTQNAFTQSSPVGFNATFERI